MRVRLEVKQLVLRVEKKGEKGNMRKGRMDSCCFVSGSSSCSVSFLSSSLRSLLYSLYSIFSLFSHFSALSSLPLALSLVLLFVLSPAEYGNSAISSRLQKRKKKEEGQRTRLKRDDCYRCCLAMCGESEGRREVIRAPLEWSFSCTDSLPN